MPTAGHTLHYDLERCSRRREEAELNGDYNDSDDDDDYDDYGGDKSDMASSVTPIPIAILYTSRQLYLEVTQVLYGSNRFTLGVSAKVALRFVKSLPPTIRGHVKDLAFSGRVAAADDAACHDFWQPLCDFISQPMRVTSVTIQLPRDQNHDIDESKESKRGPNGEWFLWPIVEKLARMLMDGKIQRLRLAYTASYLRPSCDEDLEGYHAIDTLRNSRSQEERDREEQEFSEYLAAGKNGRPHKFDSIGALYKDQGERRQKLDFVVSREDNPIGDVGTVLVLTRPNKT